MSSIIVNNRKHVYDQHGNPAWETAIKGLYKNIDEAKKALKSMYEGDKMGYSMVHHKFGPNYDNLITNKMGPAKKTQEIAIIDDYFKNHLLKEFGKPFVEPSAHKLGPDAQKGICQHVLSKASKSVMRVNSFENIKVNAKDHKVSSLEPPSLIKFLDKMSHPHQKHQYRYAKDQLKAELADKKKRFKETNKVDIDALDRLNDNFALNCRGSLNGEEMKLECEGAFSQFEELNSFMKSIIAFSGDMSSDRTEEFIRVIMQDPNETVLTLNALHQNGLINAQLRGFLNRCADLLRENIAFRNRWLVNLNDLEKQLKELRDKHKHVRPTVILHPLTVELVDAFLGVVGQPLVHDAVPANPLAQEPPVAPAQDDPNAQPVADQQAEPPAQNLLPPPTNLPPPPPIPKQDVAVQLPANEPVPQPIVHQSTLAQQQPQPIDHQPPAPDPQPVKQPPALKPAAPKPLPPTPKAPPLPKAKNPFQKIVLKKVGADQKRYADSPQAPQYNRQPVKPPVEHKGGTRENFDRPQAVQGNQRAEAKANAQEVQSEKKPVPEIKEKKKSFLRTIFSPYIWLGEILKLLCVRLFTKQPKQLNPKRK